MDGQLVNAGAASSRAHAATNSSSWLVSFMGTDPPRRGVARRQDAAESSAWPSRSCLDQCGQGGLILGFGIERQQCFRCRGADQALIGSDQDQVISGDP